MTKLIFLSGSIRNGSYNEALAKVACKIASSHEGVDAEFIDLAEYEMPIFNEDIETGGFPQTVLELKSKFLECDGFFIASPEYNSTFSALLKNILDWMSRKTTEDEPMLAAYSGKVAALASASLGGLGGIRGLPPLRVLLSNIMVHVIPSQLALGNAVQAFDEEGNLNNKNQAEMLNNLVSELVNTAKKLKN